jgi:hypothetical protein
MSTDDEVAAEVDPRYNPDIPHGARIWNYWVGGKDNFPADREVAEAAITAYPGIVAIARESRKALARVVRYLVEEAGVRQFLDIGTGLPTENNTHEVAQRSAPECRIVYVDNDRCKSGCTHARQGLHHALGLCLRPLTTASGPA